MASLALPEKKAKLKQQTCWYNKSVHSVGEGLSEAVRIYRVTCKVVSTFMKAGVPLDKVDTFHEFLEENAFRLSNKVTIYM